MATSPNFSWPEPDNTDLVKNGALAIRTAINAIDTSMVDLKGGTTGQVLAKASATDMDFSWVTDATGIPATIIDAKGDLIAGTAADTAARLAVGANGTTLVADSSTATGLKWDTLSSGLTYTTWTTTIAGITVGNGTTVARYAQSGKFVTGSFLFTLGSTSSVSGPVSFTLPVTAKSTNVLNGIVTFLDSGVGYHVGKALQTSTTLCYLEVLGTNTTYGSFVDITSTVPITWATNDFLSCNFSYEAA